MAASVASRGLGIPNLGEGNCRAPAGQAGQAGEGRPRAQATREGLHESIACLPSSLVTAASRSRGELRDPAGQRGVSQMQLMSDFSSRLSPCPALHRKWIPNGKHWPGGFQTPFPEPSERAP